MHRHLYVKQLKQVYAAAADAYLIDDVVPPGHVLTVHRTAAWFTNIANSEYIWWFIRHAGEYLFLGDDKPGSTNAPAQRDLQTTIGEGMAFGVYSPDITTGEVFHLVLTGAIYPLETWQQGIVY